MADVRFDGDAVIITISKAIVVISRQTFVDGLKRGKGYQRRKAMAARLTRLPQAARSLRDEGGDPC